MQNILRWLVLTVGLLVGIALVAVVLRRMVRNIERTLRRRVFECLEAGETVLLEDYRANFFGLESLGGWQLRGNGVLVLTDRALEFLMLWPRRRFRVPLAEVTGSFVVRSHCGKSVGRDLFKVRVQAGGREDSLAWFVPNASGWRAALDTALSRFGERPDGR